MIRHIDNRKLFRSKLTKQQEENSGVNLKEGDLGIIRMSSYPRRIVAELSNRCNLGCIMCGRTGRELTYSDMKLEWLRKIEESFCYSEEIVLHGWGEPLMNSSFSDILKYLDGFPLRKYFCTNGMLLDRYMQSVFDNHVDILAISLDGAKKETDEAIRKGSDYDRVIANVKDITSYKDRNGLAYPYINFVFTGMAGNIGEFPDMIDLAYDLAVPEVKFVYLTSFGPEMRSESLWGRQDEVKKAFNEAAARAEKKGMTVKLPYIQGEDPAGDMPHGHCYFPYRDLFVGSDGYVRPCVSCPDRYFSVMSAGSFDDIWNSPELCGLRERINSQDKSPEGCLGCYHSSCANWNLRSSYIRESEGLLPEWEASDA